MGNFSRQPPSSPRHYRHCRSHDQGLSAWQLRAGGTRWRWGRLTRCAATWPTNTEIDGLDLESVRVPVETRDLAASIGELEQVKSAAARRLCRSGEEDCGSMPGG
jgi:hypothetical protein